VCRGGYLLLQFEGAEEVGLASLAFVIVVAAVVEFVLVEADVVVGLEVDRDLAGVSGK